MILELRNKTPFINFGFNRISKTGFTGETIDVWLNTSYNQDTYNSFVITAPTAVSITKINNYHYQVTFDTLGSKTIDLTIQDVPKDIVLNSNTLSLEILNPKADNTRIKADNTIITADTF